MTLPPTFVCAWLSWNLVERQILGRKADILVALDRAIEATAQRWAVFPGRVRGLADPRLWRPG